MSFLTNPFKVLYDAFENLKTKWQSTTIGQEVDSAAASAKTELESLLPEVLETAVSATSAAMLPALASGGGVDAIISAGVAAAIASFKASAVTVTDTTISNFVSTLHNSLSAQIAAN